VTLALMLVILGLKIRHGWLAPRRDAVP